MSLLCNDLLKGLIKAKCNIEDSVLTVSVNVDEFLPKNLLCKTHTDGFGSTLILSGTRKTVVKKTGQKRLREFIYTKQLNFAKLDTLNARIENDVLTVSVELEVPKNGEIKVPIQE